MVSSPSACLFIVLYPSASLNRDSCGCRSELRKAACTYYMAVRARQLCMKCQQQGMGKQDFRQEFQTASDSATTMYNLPVALTPALSHN